MNESIINSRVKDFDKALDVFQTILIFLLALAVPTFLSEILKSLFGSSSVLANNAQIIVGSIVNTILIASALNLKGWIKIVGVVTMPSISTILSGYVFQSASPFMMYMVPAIWIGNFVLIYCYKYLFLNKKINYFVTGIVGVLFKVLVIFSWFCLFNYLDIFPLKVATLFKTAMGMTQLITGFIGVLLFFPIYKLEKGK